MTNDWGRCSTGLRHWREIGARQRFSTHLSTTTPFDPICEGTDRARERGGPVEIARIT